MYAHALFDELGFDAVTVNPYMGKDSVLPFLKNPQRGAFVLALTSNEGAKDFQYLRVKAKPLYERVIATTKRWNTQHNCGLVVGATKPAELRRARELAPDLPFLIPGVGAQGGDLEASVRYGCTHNDDLALINVGRSILYASSGKDFAREARKVAITFRDDMNHFRSLFFS
jgi:orotidine-5'-phosphate decarboxylase